MTKRLLIILTPTRLHCRQAGVLTVGLARGKPILDGV
jgi:hypothetical protein